MSLKKTLCEFVDPAQCCITVAPKDISKFSSKDLSASDYIVIHGVQRVKALKELQQENKLPPMLDALDQKVGCYVVNTASTELLNYGNIRGNVINSQYFKKPLPQDLLTVFDVLRRETGGSSKEVLKTIERYAVFQLMRDEDFTAIKKLCQWEKTDFDKLLEVSFFFEFKIL